MRKRSSYKPKGVRLDVMAWVKSGMLKVDQVDHAGITLKIKNHDALTNIAHGKGTRSDMDVVIAALNIAEALIMQNVASAYKEQLRQGQDALKSMGSRGRSMGDRFVCTGQELTAINWAMEIHDAQLEVINVAQLETAIKKVAAIVRSGGERKI